MMTEANEILLAHQRFRSGTEPRFDFELAITQTDRRHRRSRWRVSVSIKSFDIGAFHTRNDDIIRGIFYAAVMGIDERHTKQLKKRRNIVKLYTHDDAMRVYTSVHLGALVYFEPFEPINWADVDNGVAGHSAGRQVVWNGVAGGAARRITVGNGVLDALGFGLNDSGRLAFKSVLKHPK